MTKLPDCFENLLAAWNQKDIAKIRGHLEKAVAADVEFADPNYHIKGIDAFEKMISEFATQYPMSRCEHTSGLDAHHNRYRYKWLVSVKNEPAVSGMDVAEVNSSGLITRVDGFFGPFPETSA